MPFNRIQPRDRLRWGAILLVIALLAAAVAVGWIGSDPSAVHAPSWVLLLVSLVFGLGGILVLIGRDSRTNDIIAGLILASMGVIGGWVSLRGSSEHFSGGLAILPRDLNVGLARVMFGLGAVMCLAMAAYAFRQGLRHETGPEQGG